jgi:hypothetical protein
MAELMNSEFWKLANRGVTSPKVRFTDMNLKFTLPAVRQILGVAV